MFDVQGRVTLRLLYQSAIEGRSRWEKSKETIESRISN